MMPWNETWLRGFFPRTGWYLHVLRRGIRITTHDLLQLIHHTAIRQITYHLMMPFKNITGKKKGEKANSEKNSHCKLAQVTNNLDCEISCTYLRIHKLKFDVYHEARQSNQLFSLASWYTSNFNLCIPLKNKNGQSAFASSHQFSRPTVTGIWKGIQWVPRGKQRLPHNRQSPSCYLSSWSGKYTAWRG